MERFILKNLTEWKASERRKPLILRGVRQCGKTWALKEFGRTAYAKTAYFSFDENPEYKTIFENTRNAGRILDQLTLASGISIDPTDTLIVFDEIQECPNALASLKYFCENAPEYHVTCAGSLLGIRLADDASFPVGKVDFLDMGPLCFSEFLIADGSANLAEYLASVDRIESIPQIFFNQLTEKLRQYFVSGGMPEVVDVWVKYRDPGLMQNTQAAILSAYDLDFSKHLDDTDAMKTSIVWQSLPKQLGRENKKFTFRLVKETARARDYELSIEWLVRAGLVLRVYRNNASGLPLSANDDYSAFKLYAVDVGLLRQLARLEVNALAIGNELFTGYKGAFNENYLIEAISQVFDVPLRYLSQTKPDLEIDFLLQYNGLIIPIEAKAGTNTVGKSLKTFLRTNGGKMPFGVRYSMQNLAFQDGILNIPLFCADISKKLINVGLSVKDGY